MNPLDIIALTNAYGDETDWDRAYYWDFYMLVVSIYDWHGNGWVVADRASESMWELDEMPHSGW